MNIENPEQLAKLLEEVRELPSPVLQPCEKCGVPSSNGVLCLVCEAFEEE